MSGKGKIYTPVRENVEHLLLHVVESIQMSWIRNQEADPDFISVSKELEQIRGRRLFMAWFKICKKGFLMLH